MAKRKIHHISYLYWLHAAFIFFAVNFVITQNLKFRFLAANCMYRDEIRNDSRCLYTYQGSVYEKGSRARPHKGNPCGTDVTTIIPSFHTAKMAKYMDPNLVGAVCTGSAAPASTPTPTLTPIPTATPRPTERILTPTPTRAPDSTVTPTPIASPLPTASPTISPTPSVTPVPTIMIIQNQSGSGFGKFIADSGRTVRSGEVQTKASDDAPVVNTQKSEVLRQNIGWWQKLTVISELLLMLSMIALIISVVVHVAQKIRYL